VKPTHASSKHRVFLVTPVSPPFGGMSLQAEKLARLLSSEGLAVTVVPTNPSPPKALRFVSRVPGVRTMVRELQYLASLLKMVRLEGVIHHLSASGLYFFLHSVPLLIVGRSFRRTVILNYRGGKAADFLRRWAWLAIPVLRLADRLVVPSEFLQGIFQQHRIRCSVLPNVADTKSFVFQARGEYLPRLLVTRHLEPMYDIESVLRAFRIVKERFPNAVLGIAGDGSEEGRLRALVQEWGLKGVNFYGFVSNCELPKLYSDHDIYVNASRVDNFPGALVEAACCGLPIVTTGAGGIPDMLRHRETGLVVEVGDFEALAVGVLGLVERQDLARRLAINARAWADQFSWEAVFPKVMDCYGFSKGTTKRCVVGDVLV
jgi:glycosyltransferase involved in cell wall biosynthesis